MPALTVRFKDKILSHNRVQKGDTISIGRLQDNDIVIDNIGVSGKHAQIVSKCGYYYIEDLNSTNGTFVNRRQITSQVLRDEDIVTIGKHELVFRLSDEIETEFVGMTKSSETMNMRDTTRAIDTRDYRKIIEKNIRDSNRATLLILRFKGAQIRKYILHPDKSILIGRLKENDILIENDAVSGRHAKIFPQDKDFFIEDLKSTNGTLVNSKQLTSQILKDGDIITIGKHELIYCENEKYTLEETLLPNVHGLSYSTPFTTMLDISKFKKP